MASFSERRNRQVVPRWREFATTAALGELSTSASDGEDDADQTGADFLRERLEAWESHRSIWHAADVVSAAYALDRADEALDAARFLQSTDAPAPLKGLAFRILNPEAADVRDKLGELSQVESRQVIRVMRQRLKDEPRNAILWIDLGRQYAVSGQIPSAARAVRLGLSLAPSNRFVVRSASRFFVHSGQLDEAHDALTAATPLLHDPWLLAAEIAVASARQKTSRVIKVARRTLDAQDFSPFALSELGAAVGTLELGSGSHRSARRLLHRVLVDPTDNALAQVEWCFASTGESEQEVEDASKRVSRPYEAVAWREFNRGHWSESAVASLNWLRDQPFSSAPAIHASFVQSAVLEDFKAATESADVGLRASRKEPMLLNNKAFSLANLGLVAEARATLDCIDRELLDAGGSAVVSATDGLIHFRAGQPDAGRLLYERAVELAKGVSLGRLRAMALILLAREEVLSGTQVGPMAIERATQAAQGILEPDVALALARLLAMPHG